MGANDCYFINFQGYHLGFVASIQMSVYDMVRGRLIAMPSNDADGDVMSINLPLKFKTGIKQSYNSYLCFHY
jgi:hypothetical protein